MRAARRAILELRRWIPSSRSSAVWRRVAHFFFADFPGKVGGLRLMGFAAAVL